MKRYFKDTFLQKEDYREPKQPFLALHHMQAKGQGPVVCLSEMMYSVLYLLGESDIHSEELTLEAIDRQIMALRLLVCVGTLNKRQSRLVKRHLINLEAFRSTWQEATWVQRFFQWTLSLLYCNGLNKQSLKTAWPTRV
jgi:hypothetical protein